MYDEMPYKDSCGLKESSEGIHVGLRSELLFLDSGGLELAEYTNSLLQGKDWNIDSQENELINGLDAITVQYRFGGTNRFGSLTLVKDEQRIFAFSFSAGGFCEIPGSPTHPDDHNCFQCDVIKHLARCVPSDGAFPIVALVTAHPPQPSIQVGSIHAASVVPRPPIRGPPLLNG